MEDQSVVLNKEEETIDLPPGFRFHPTDEEIITHYLTPKVVNSSFVATAIGDVDLNKCEPWDLPKRAKMGEKEWYFFCQRDRKYPTGTRTNRATESGYWKATGKDKEIFKGKGCLVGMKKTLVFYRGRAPKGEKTNWVMHEFRLDGKLSYYNLAKIAKDDWVVCRVFHKSSGMKKASSPLMIPGGETGLSRIMMDSFLNCSSSSPPPLVTASFDHHDEEDDGRDYNYYPTLDHHQPLIYNNYYQTFMNQHSSRPNPVFPSSAVQGLSIKRPRCKTEQFSSTHGSTVITRSQDTGLSTDMNNNTTEISSSKLENDNNNHYNLGMSVEIPDIVADIDCFWEF